MSQAQRQDPLAALVVDAHSVDRETLARALNGWARIDPREGLIRFVPAAKENGTIKQLILAVLLGQMAIQLLNDEQDGGLAPHELEHRTGVKGGSLRPQLKALADGGVVSRRRDGRYVVLPAAVDRAAALLGANDG